MENEQLNGTNFLPKRPVYEQTALQWCNYKQHLVFDS